MPWDTSTVADLQERGWLLVEDGNHGEYRPLPHEFGAGETAFIRAADLSNGSVLFESAERINDVARQRIRKGVGAPRDVLLTHKGTVGKLAFVGESAPPFVCSPQTTFWRSLDADKINQRYLFCFLRSPGFREQLESRKDETDMAPYVSLTAQRQLKVDLPSITEQRAIARVLGALDDKMELNRRLNRSLEELAQAVFRSWFVDFDPVTAKASGRPPVGLDPATAALFPDHFQDSELGKIPNGWRVGRLDEVAEITMGTSPSGDTYNDVGNGTPLINGPVEYGDFFPVKIKWTTEPTRYCQNDDLIFCVRGSTTGRRVVSDGVYCLGRGVCGIHGRDGNQGFVDLAIEQGMDSLLSRATGSTFPSLNGPEIKGLSLVIPLDPILRRFADAVDPLRERIRSNIREQHSLAAARDALLPPLLSGELRVPDAERFVEQLA